MPVSKVLICSLGTIFNHRLVKEALVKERLVKEKYDDIALSKYLD